jgi:phospholipid/cholesterol/gamma-HCH transport system substrate-binding protein
MLAGSDGKVRVFKTQLDNVAQIFADERDDLGGALSELADALGRVRSFVADNRDLLKSNVDKLAGTTQVLVKERDSLAEALDRAPKALTDLLDAYDPATGTIDSRANLNEFSFPLPSVGGAR